MKPIEFPEVNTIIGRGQAAYRELPSHVWKGEDGKPDPQGAMTFCYELTPEEKQQVAETGHLWLTQLTFGARFQPIVCSTTSPFAKGQEAEMKVVRVTLQRCPACGEDHESLVAARAPEEDTQAGEKAYCVECPNMGYNVFCFPEGG